LNKKGNITLKNLARSASATALLLIISKILGFAREVFLADRFGVTEPFMAKAVCWYAHGNLAADLYM